MYNTPLRLSRSTLCQRVGRLRAPRSASSTSFRCTFPSTKQNRHLNTLTLPTKKLTSPNPILAGIHAVMGNRSYGNEKQIKLRDNLAVPIFVDPCRSIQMSWSVCPAASLVEVCIVVNGQAKTKDTGADREEPGQNRQTHSKDSHNTLPGTRVTNLLYTLRRPNIPGRAETSIRDGNAGDPTGPNGNFFQCFEKNY